MLKLLPIVIMTIAFLSACSAMPVAEQLVGPDLERQDWDMPSEVQHDLRNLPDSAGTIVASIYNFRDLTGQYKPAPSSSFSTAVSQGAAAMLLKAVRDSKWFAPLEREGLQDLLTERKIIRAALKSQNQGYDVPPLLGANILLEGGIIGYDTNMKTGGAGAKYFGIGVSEQYRMDQVTVNLRAVDVNSGRVINSVTTSRSILSRSVNGGAFRFVRFKRLLEMEGGYTRNEPVQLCLLETIQAAVIRLVVEGIEDGSWSLKNPAQSDHPLLFKYGTRVKPEPQDAGDDTQEKDNAQSESATDSAQEPQQTEETAPEMAAAAPASPAPVEKPAVSVPKTAAQVTVKKAPPKAPLTVQHAEDDFAKIDKTSHPMMVHQELIKDGDNYFVIQLMSSGSAMELIKFVEMAQLSREMIEYIHYEDKGQDRFAVLYGRFRSKNNAIKAIETLAPALRIHEPWVRSVSS